ncbi:hypothetical protein PR202_gn00415 [Eleusine coracana subsp. coracana]|uniref:Auxin efflux carrier component n=1 Tax=Eleusine coracana subsp. coracana TaxID=191504 RepID=A0AAV5G2I8_ELECO|nr:hypothetical protein PR202_gn00415 [Eleusine coracana subsp. coracana]
MIGWGDVYKLFTPDQCGAINRLVIYFAYPFFGFDLAARAGTFAASYRVLAADVVTKAGIALGLAVWEAARRPSSYSWCITGFSLVALNNALLMGVPLLDAMYGGWAHDVAVQMAMMQIVVRFPLMLVVFEARQAWLETMPVSVAPPDDGRASSADHEAPVMSDVDEPEDDRKMRTGWSFWAMLLRTVAHKLACNPNVYSSLLGVAWSSIAHKHGDKFIMCGARLTALSLVLRFVAGPAAATVGAVVLGLRGDLLRFAIVQAALPQSVATFNFAREYDLHADILSTAIIVGTLVSLPVLIAYYTVLGLIR